MGLQTTTHFDGLGRAIRTVVQEDSSTIQTCTEYDALGRVESVSNPGRNACSSDVTVNTYDALGRVTLVTKPGGAEVDTDYAGNITDVYDEDENRRRTVTDALGRLTQVTEYPDNGGPNYVTDYGYDALDNLVSVTQGAQTRTFAYDDLSRLICASNPESRVGATSCTGATTGSPISGVDWFVYDPNGNVTGKTDSRSITVNHTYDALNRVKTRTFAGDGGLTPSVTFTYDDPTVPNSKGKLTEVANGSSTRYNSYDALGRIAASVQTTGGQQYEFGYQYNLDGTLKAQQYPYPSERVVFFEYDQAGRPVKAGLTAVDPDDYVQDIDYAPHGAPAVMTLGNGVVETTGFNNRLQPTAIQAGSLLTLGFGYGTANQNNGNVRTQTIQAPGLLATLTQTYDYDGVNRLESASESNSWSRGYGYDTYGNRWIASANHTLSMATPTAQGQFSAVTNRLSKSFNDANLPGDAHDAAGNLQNHPFMGQMTYNAENRQTSFTSGGTTASYSYDGEGRRVMKTVGSAATVFVYDAFGNLAAEYATTPPQGSATGRYFRTTDHLGSTRLVTDTDGDCVLLRDFFPFGEKISATAANGGRDQASCYNGGDPVRQQFTGKERDDESGLDYFLTRYSSSALGRFTGPDVRNIMMDARDEKELLAFLSRPQNWNSYGYTRNSPLSLVDPDGRSPIDPSQLRKQIFFEQGGYRVRIDIQPEDLHNAHVETKGGQRIGRMSISDKGKFWFKSVKGKRIPGDLAIAVKGRVQQYVKKMKSSNLALNALLLLPAIGDLVQASSTGFITTARLSRTSGPRDCGRILGWRRSDSGRWWPGRRHSNVRSPGRSVRQYEQGRLP